MHLLPEELEALVYTGGQTGIKGLASDMSPQEEISGKRPFELARPQHVLGSFIESEGSLSPQFFGEGQEVAAMLRGPRHPVGLCRH
jgi:hypothetical protein